LYHEKTRAAGGKIRKKLQGREDEKDESKEQKAG
jgi:hypothetical protein